MKKYLLLFVFVSLVAGCSGSKDTEQTTEKKEQKKEEVYVFDDETENPPKVNEAEIEEPKNTVVISEENSVQNLYYVQLGAYTTKAKADKFIKENQNKIYNNMSVQFDESKYLFVVQLSPYTTKEEAQIVRDQLWKIPAFKDAWIREEVK
ncbi:MAG: SPOR domain-containing protein [bacterium]